MAKNKIFSGEKGSGEEYKYKFAEELKKERIAAARAKRRAEKFERFLGRYKEAGGSGEKKGANAENKWLLMKKALGKDAYEDIYEDLGYESGDIIDAADYIADNYVRGEDGLYFNKKDMVDTIKMLKDKAYGSLDPNNVPKL